MEDVTPPEDLMREHGVLNRVLLVYGAAIQRFGQNESFDTSIISKSARIIRDFIEDYHERNEEHFVFPRFKRAGKLVGLVDVLYQQHQAGRRLTDTILHLVPTSATPGDDRHKLVEAIEAFIRMYRPHEAREDTVLFPALRSVVSPNEFDAMGEDFEKDERQKFGEDGFEKVVSQVAGLERALGIHDLRGRFETRMSGAQLIEQRLSFFQIERIEASGEPAVDQSEQIACLILLTLVASRHAHHWAQFSRLCLLPDTRPGMTRHNLLQLSGITPLSRPSPPPLGRAQYRR